VSTSATIKATYDSLPNVYCKWLHRKAIVIIKDSIISADIYESRFINCMEKLCEYIAKISFFISGVLI